MRMVMGAVGVRGARALIDGVRLARRVMTGSWIAPGPADSERVMPDEALAPLTARLLAGLDVPREGSRRQELYRQCRERLTGVGEVRPVFGDLTPGVVPQGFPFLFTGVDPDRFIARWWRAGVPMIQWPALPSALGPEIPDHYRRLMLVPFLW